MTTRRTIRTVSDEVNEWTSKDGQRRINYIRGTFTDGDSWSVGTAQKNTEAIKAKLKGLAGTEADFALEHNGRKDDQDDWKLSDYPGKPKGSIPYPGENGAGGGAPGSSGGGQGGSAASASTTYTDPTRGSIEAQVAAKIAGEVAVAVAERFKFNDEQLWGFIEQGTLRIAATIAKAAGGAGSPPAASKAPTPTPEPSAAPEPSPGPESGNGGRTDRAALIDEALKIFGTGSAIEQAWVTAYGDERGVVDIKLAEIEDPELVTLIWGRGGSPE